MIEVVRKSYIKMQTEEYKEKNVLELQNIKEELILLYKGKKYFGYADTRTGFPRITPETVPSFEPEELIWEEETMDKAQRLFDRSVALELIPIKYVSENSREEVEFLHKRKSEPKEMAILQCLKGFKAYGDYRLDDDEMIWIEGGLNEITWRYYWILKNKGAKVFLSDFDKKWGEKNELDSACRVSRYTEQDIANKLYVVNRCIYREAKKSLGTEVKSITASIPGGERIGKKGNEDFWNRFHITYHEVMRFIDEQRDLGTVGEWFLSNFVGMDGICSEKTKNQLLNEHRGQKKYIFGTEKRKIYLVGPCIVCGGESPEQDSLAQILYELLQEKELPFSIQKVGIGRGEYYTQILKRRLRKLDLKKGDIIIFIDDNIPNPDIDLTAVFEARNPDEWWFTDEPIHTLRKGNEAIARTIIPYIEQAAKQMKDVDAYVQVGVPALTIDEKRELEDYLTSVRTVVDPASSKRIGAIVMNANPFTYGHQYLIEQALVSDKIDFLYIFVVQEDTSDFTFKDRIELVCQGISHLKKVAVVPSGRFILSRKTMSAYFEKEWLQEETIDASEDVAIFGAYVAPQLNITARFVGEEPLDAVTRQYNEEMKKKFSGFGIDFVEIPRCKTGKDVISATKVRQLYKERNWELLEKYVPKTTLTFLKTEPELQDKGEFRGKITGECHKWDKVFAENEHVIFYGIGTDGNGLYIQLGDKEKEKVIFCDRKAENKDLLFFEKKVHKPEELLGVELQNFPVVITSTLYGKEIGRDLIKRGVSVKRIYINDEIFGKMPAY